MKSLVIFAAFVALTAAQRPSFAGILPKGPQFNGVHNNFRDTTASGISVDLANRLGEIDQNANLPLEANGDTKLVQRLESWPRENRPFWLLNAEQIDQHRNPTRNVQQNVIQLQSRNAIPPDDFFEDKDFNDNKDYQRQLQLKNRNDFKEYQQYSGNNEPNNYNHYTNVRYFPTFRGGSY